MSIRISWETPAIISGANAAFAGYNIQRKQSQAQEQQMQFQADQAFGQQVGQAFQNFAQPVGAAVAGRILGPELKNNNKLAQAYMASVMGGSAANYAPQTFQSPIGGPGFTAQDLSNIGRQYLGGGTPFNFGTPPPVSTAPPPRAQQGAFVPGSSQATLALGTSRPQANRPITAGGGGSPAQPIVNANVPQQGGGVGFAPPQRQPMNEAQIEQAAARAGMTPERYTAMAGLGALQDYARQRSIRGDLVREDAIQGARTQGADERYQNRIARAASEDARRGIEKSLLKRIAEYTGPQGKEIPFKTQREIKTIQARLSDAAADPRQAPYLSRFRTQALNKIVKMLEPLPDRKPPDIPHSLDDLIGKGQAIRIDGSNIAFVDPKSGKWQGYKLATPMPTDASSMEGFFQSNVYTDESGRTWHTDAINEAKGSGESGGMDDASVLGYMKELLKTKMVDADGNEKPIDPAAAADQAFKMWMAERQLKTQLKQQQALDAKQRHDQEANAKQNQLIQQRLAEQEKAAQLQRRQAAEELQNMLATYGGEDYLPVDQLAKYQKLTEAASQLTPGEQKEQQLRQRADQMRRSAGFNDTRQRMAVAYRTSGLQEALNVLKAAAEQGNVDDRQYSILREGVTRMHWATQARQEQAAGRGP